LTYECNRDMSYLSTEFKVERLWAFRVGENDMTRKFGSSMYILLKSSNDVWCEIIAKQSVQILIDIGGEVITTLSIL
jgi:hypothetical protein